MELKYYVVDRNSEEYQRCKKLRKKAIELTEKRREITKQFGAVGSTQVGDQVQYLIFKEEQKDKHFKLLHINDNGWVYDLDKRYKKGKEIANILKNIELFDNVEFNDVFNFEPEILEVNGNSAFFRSISIGWDLQDFYVRIDPRCKYSKESLIEITHTQFKERKYPIK